MFIRSLSLTNILSFSAQALELKPLNILIGANGSGKSNLIDCLEFLHALPNDLAGFINRRGGTEAWVWKGTHQLEHAVRIACEFRLENLELRYEIEISAVSRVLEIAAESLIGVGGDRRHYLSRTGGVLRIGPNGSGNIGLGIGAVTPAQSALQAYRNPIDPDPVTLSGPAFDSIRIYRGFETGDDSDIRQGVSSSVPKHPLATDGSNLALVLQEMHFLGRLQAVEGFLNRFSDRFEGIKIRLEGARAALYVKERGLEMIPAARLSDGTLRFLCLLAVLLDHDPPPLICLEEPEVGLHPDALAVVDDALREASNRTQLIVTTHSDALIDRFGDDPDAVVVCERDFDESTTFRRLSKERLEEWLANYSVGDLWRRGELGGTQK